MRTPSGAPTRSPSCRTRASSPTPRRTTRATPTPTPVGGCCRSSPTRTAARTSPSSTPRGTTSRTEGGHRGEHGSLDVVQSRAPLLVAGAGAARPRRRRRPRPGRRRRTDAAARRGRRPPNACSTPRAPRSTAAPGRTCCRPRRRSLRGRPPVGRRALLGPAAARRGGRAARGRSAARGGHGARRRGRGRVPEHHLVQPHLGAHRGRPGPARGARQRVLRPADRRAGRPQRRDDVAPVRDVVPAGGRHRLRDRSSPSGRV